MQGVGDAKTQAAIVCEANLMARDVKTNGYAQALKSNLPAATGIQANSFKQWLSKPVTRLFPGNSEGLRLPIRETPLSPRDGDITKWVSIVKFGAVADDGKDDAPAIQAAIDSGARTIYLPRGHYEIGQTIVLRNNLQSLIGCKAWLQVLAPLSAAKAPVFRVAETGAPMVELDGIDTDFSSGAHFFLENNSARTLVLRRMQINFQGADAYHGNSKADEMGTVFLEDVVGRWFKFEHQKVWARQFNVEGDGTHISNRGGTMWILGYKTEGYGTLLETVDGGTTELLGGLSYTVGDERDEPMFVIDDSSRASISISEANFSGKPFAHIVQQTRAGQTRVLARDDANWGRVFTLFSSH